VSRIGRFLEFGVQTPDILHSLHFYKTLGFTEMEIGEMWPHKYAVLSDGEIAIGLHDRDMDGPAVTYVQPDLAKHARNMADHGFEFSYLQLDEDAFNEVHFKDRDDHLVTMQEARTFSPGDDTLSDSVCGSLVELTLPVRETVRAAAFWAPIAPVLLEMREEPTTHMRFDAGGVPLGLSESIALQQPSLCFRCHDKQAFKDLVEQQGLDCEKFPGYEGAFAALKAPEGTRLYVFDEDFLGEAYEVDESGDVSEFPA